MNLRPLIGQLLAMFVIVGLVAAPLVTPAAAKRLAVTEMSDMSAMAGDMPCCPDGQNKDCTDCLLLAMCMLTIAQAEPPVSSGVRPPLPTRRLYSAFNDLIADGLIRSPPDHPPRSSI